MFEKIKSDLLQAMKDQEKFRLSVLRMLKSAVQNEQIEKKHELSDEEVLAVIKREVKKRKSTLDEYIKLGREEAGASLNDEIAILNEYLPEELSDEEVEQIVLKAIEDNSPATIKEMGRLSKQLKNNMVLLSIWEKFLTRKRTPILNTYVFFFICHHIIYGERYARYYKIIYQ